MSFDWRHDEFPKRGFSDDAQIGLIAQDVEVVVPEAVTTDQTGWKSLRYSALGVLLIEAVKDQQAQITTLLDEGHAVIRMNKELFDTRDIDFASVNQKSS